MFALAVPALGALVAEPLYVLADTAVVGNIGTADRLEFSVIGPAANETARIEALSKTTGADVVVSESVVHHVPPPGGGAWTSLGRFPLRGVERQVEVFSLPG